MLISALNAESEERAEPRRSSAKADQSFHRQGVRLKDTVHQQTDLNRVNFEVNNLKPFACLAFPLSLPLKRALKRPSFGDELVTSFPMP